MSNFEWRLSNQVYIDRVLYQVRSLGPGRRIAIWTSGCDKRCSGCANPELWIQHPEQYITPRRLVDNINKNINDVIEGITISGGEPFLQAEELIEFLDLLSIKGDILVFTGYTYEALLSNDVSKRLLDKIDVLIDGEYKDSLNDGKSALRGSTNQRRLYLNSRIINQYECYLEQGRTIQNFVYDYNILSVGIHNPGIKDSKEV